MRVLRFRPPSRIVRFAAALAIAGTAACRTAPVANTTAVRPVEDQELAGILARNFGAYDAGVFAVAENGTTSWLTNVPAGGTRTIPVTAHHLQAAGLVLRVQIIGSGRTWTSGPTLIDGQATGVLDVAVDPVGNPDGTQLRFVPTTVFHTEMR